MLSANETGHHDAMGNSWEWMEDQFSPLEGFATHHIYADFSTPCFDNQHNMIGGGSFISTGNEASVFARYAFRPHFLQHSSFRLVHSKTDAPAGRVKNLTGFEGNSDNVYETDELVAMYLGMHYALRSGSSEGVPAILPHKNEPTHALRFPQRVAELAVQLRAPDSSKDGRPLRALDVGCAVGGSSFELATAFDEVVGFDFSDAFVNTAKLMQRTEDPRFSIPMEGNLAEEVTALHESHVDKVARDRCTFQHGDACNMDPSDLGGHFDAVIVANLICRVPEPLKCLDGLAAVTRQGGIVVLATPFSWLKQYTEESKWLGGYIGADGKPVESKVTLQQEMESRGFEKIHEEQMPALIREHQRKYQYIVSEGTAWRKL
jgi:putative 4-mercaptohistidine N1-methyltranferase